MRRTRVSLAVVLVFLLGLVVTGQQVTVEGELVSAKCYLRADLTGNDHLGMEGCGTACVRSGNPVGLLTAEGTYYTLVVPALEIADQATSSVVSLYGLPISRVSISPNNAREARILAAT